MEFQYLAQASALIRTSGVTLLSDPWFSGPAHLGAWIPVPNWTPAEREEIRQRCEQATHIYVSHAHEDHFDVEFLNSLPPRTIVTGAFRSSQFSQMLAAVADRHSIERLENEQTLSLGDGVAVTIYLEQPAYRTNSMLLLESADGSVLNGNDCGINSNLLERIASRGNLSAFLYTLNFAANGFPYGYLRSTQTDLHDRIHQVRNGLVDAFRTAMQILRPAAGIVFAGPVTFADAQSAFLDTFPESLDWSQMVLELADTGNIIWPAPFSRIGLDGCTVDDSGVLQWDRYLTGGAPPRVAADDDTLLSRPAPDRTALLAAAETLSRRLAELQARIPSEKLRTALLLATVGSLDDLETDAPDLRLLLKPGEPVEFVAAGARVRPPYLSITTIPSIMHDFCLSMADYDALMLSLRARFARVPDEFDSFLHNLLRFGHDEGASSALAEWYEERARRRASETLTVESGGRSFEIPRYCPHEGEAFDNARVDNGCIVCPRHRWRYDLETGDCIKGGPADLNLYKTGDIASGGN